jgi:hypothetical protein
MRIEGSGAFGQIYEAQKAMEAQKINAARNVYAAKKAMEVEQMGGDLISEMLRKAAESQKQNSGGMGSESKQNRGGGFKRSSGNHIDYYA